MKRFIIFIILSIFLILFFGFVIYYKQNYMNRWEVKITLYEINLREKPSTDSRKISSVVKGRTYQAIDMTEDDVYFWYKIKKDGGIGWIASDKESPYLEDINNPKDITPPTIKYFEDVYTVDYISDINFNKLEITDNSNYYDRNFKIIIEDAAKEKYWIEYIAKDPTGNITTKTQSLIVNKEKPDNKGFWILK